jgi:hypothetical protein
MINNLTGMDTEKSPMKLCPRKRLRQRMTEAVKTGVKKEELAKRLKTDDLGWPFPQARLDELWDEFGAGRR